MPRRSTPCSFPRCPRTFFALGLCKLHWTQQYQGRPLSLPREPADCSFRGCDRGGYAKGLCRSHYQQQRRGRPLTALGPARR